MPRDEAIQTKEGVQSAAADLLKTFSFVPDDRLGWSPSEAARSPLWMVGHCAEANQAFACFIRGEAPPMAENMSPEEIDRSIRDAGRATATREEAVRAVEASCQAVADALDALDSETIERTVDSPFGPTPVRFWMGLPAIHMTGHARQLDYMQTIWGDLQDHQFG